MGLPVGSNRTRETKLNDLGYWMTRRRLVASAKDKGWRKKWLANLETQNAVVGDLYNIPKCGLFGCDDKVKISGNRWKCVACGEITKAVD